MLLTSAETAALLLSMKVSLTAVIITFPIALYLSYLLATKEFRGKLIVDILIHVPIIVPPVVIGYGLLILFAPGSTLGSFLDQLGIPIAFSWRGAALASGVMAFPLMVRAFRLGLENENPRLKLASKTLGASPLHHFIYISLPLSKNAILTGLTLGFARAIGEFGATITFVSNIEGLTRTLPLALFTAIQTPNGELPAMRLALICLVPAFTAIILSEYLAFKNKKQS